MLVILGPQTRRAFGSAAIGQDGFIGLTNDGAAPGGERDHLAIARVMRLPVAGFRDNEQRAWIGALLPTGPRAACIVKTRRIPKESISGL